MINQLRVLILVLIPGMYFEMRFIDLLTFV